LSGTAPEAQHLMRSVFDASYELGRRRGDGVVRFTMVADEDSGEPQESAADETVASIAEIAQMIRHRAPARGNTRSDPLSAGGQRRLRHVLAAAGCRGHLVRGSSTR
ncbi:hypothetical protein, partial [Glutamicibacter protophormiae]